MGSDKRPKVSGKILNQQKETTGRMASCPNCGGSGRIASKACIACGGAGRRRL